MLQICKAQLDLNLGSQKVEKGACQNVLDEWSISRAKISSGMKETTSNRMEHRISQGHVVLNGWYAGGLGA